MTGEIREHWALTEGPQNDAHHPVGSVSLTCASLAGTVGLAGVLARHLGPGDVVLLDGALAAGKTTFVTQICRALNCEDQPSSPTYAISNIYTCPGFEIFHVDAYRLSGVDEFYNLGIDEFFPDALALIEWGARLEGAFADGLQIDIAFADDRPEARIYTFSATAGRWQPVLADLARHCSNEGTAP